MIEVKIDLSEHADLIKRFDGAETVIREEATIFVNRMTTAGSNIAKDLVGKKTHTLERSITALPATWAGGTVTGAWGTNVPYARMHEEGTDPHVIFPKRAKALRWMVGGKAVFARRVNHPGTKPRLYMKGSMDRIERGLSSNGETLKARIVSRLSQGGA